MVTNEELQMMKILVFDSIKKNKKICQLEYPSCKFCFVALSSLRSQIMIRNLKWESSAIEKILPSIIKRVESGEKLFQIAKNNGFSSYKLAKAYMNKVLKVRVPVSSFIESPLSVINDIALIKDLLNCFAQDLTCSHEISQLSECSGREYEEFLIENLIRLHMCFETEVDLRSRGKPKTPDILFLIPMATKTPYSKQSYVLVNWIDSKAFFADELTYSEHLEQFKAYTNRYGRGMVIYWHGFVDSLLTTAQDSIVITDSFPDCWLFPTGEITASIGPSPVPVMPLPLEWKQSSKPSSISNSDANGSLVGDQHQSVVGLATGGSKGALTVSIL